MTRIIAATCRDSGFARTSVWSFTRNGAPAYTTVTRESYVGFGAGAGSKVDGVFWFNTFSVPEYSRSTCPRPALVLNAPEKLRRAHWLYWQIYTTRIDPRAYAALFQRSLWWDFPLLIVAMRALGWLKSDTNGWALTERGALWAHRVQMLYSLTFIDDLWSHCQSEAWPAQIVLS